MTEATPLQLIHSAVLMAAGNASIAKDTFARLEVLAETHHANLELSPSLQVLADSAFRKAERARCSAFQARQLSRESRRDGGTLTSAVRQTRQLARMASLAATAGINIERDANRAIDEETARGGEAVQEQLESDRDQEAGES